MYRDVNSSIRAGLFAALILASSFFFGCATAPTDEDVEMNPPVFTSSYPQKRYIFDHDLNEYDNDEPSILEQIFDSTDRAADELEESNEEDERYGN